MLQLKNIKKRKSLIIPHLAKLITNPYNDSTCTIIFIREDVSFYRINCPPALLLKSTNSSSNPL